MDDKAAPRPWKVGDESQFLLDIQDANGEYLFSLSLYDHANPNAAMLGRANARLLTRSVNSAPVAERLAEAAKVFIRIADRDTDECNALRTAIADYEKAKGNQ